MINFLKAQRQRVGPLGPAAVFPSPHELVGPLT